MSGNSPDPRVYLLADHLDNILSCGEDLLATMAPPDPRAVSERRLFVETVRTLEVRIVSRVLLAREQADAVRRIDRRVAPMVAMFQSGTLELSDAAADLADSTGPDFLTGNDAIAYLRGRGVIAADRAGLTTGEPLIATEAFSIAGVTPLGALLDLSSAFLDALEAQYDLYDGASVARKPRADASESEAPAAGASGREATT